MRNTSQLQISVPCHELWDKMTKTEKGKFCNSCHKTVVDFTGMSDAQLIAFFKRSSTGSVCGRFNSDQLNRDITQPAKQLPWLKYFFSILLPAFLFSYKAKTQGSLVKITGDTVFAETTAKKLDENGIPVQKPLVLQKKIVGRITDIEGRPIAYTTVMFKGTTWGVMSDEKGYYAISVPAQLEKKVLVFSSVGFQSRQIEVDRNNSKTPVDVSLVILQSEILGEVIIVEKYTNRKKRSQ